MATDRRFALLGHKHKLSSLLSDTLTAGDVLFVNSSGVLALLPKANDGELLTLASGLPSWAAGGGGGISNVVEDLSPQLGGDLDLNSSDITGTGNLNITGNIVLSGTVDGIDIATDVAANTAKNTNVSTALSIGTVTATTFGITSDGGADDVVLPEADTDDAGLLGADKWDEIVANTLKNTNVSTALSIGTVTATTFGITSDGGADDIILPEADTDDAGLLGADKWDEIVANTLKNTNVSTALSLGTVTATTIGITSDGAADDVVLPEADTDDAGLLGADKWDEIVANTAKSTNVSTALSTGTVDGTSYGITSDGGADDVIIAQADTNNAGVLSAAKWDEIVANTAKTSNATHTGDVTGSVALAIANNAVTLAHMAHGTDGELITYSAIGAPVTVPVGTAGHVLTSGGTGVAPTFQATASGQLSDLSDVGVTTATDKNALMADGDSWESRALVEDDISDLGTYLTAEVNDLTDAVTWDDIPDANVPLSAIDQHVAWVNVSEDTNDVIDSQYIQGAYVKVGAFGKTATLEDSSTTTFPAGANCVILNLHASTEDITITEGSGTTLYILDGSTVTDTTGGCTLGPGGYATLYRYSATVYYIMGAGLTA